LVAAGAAVGAVAGTVVGAEAGAAAGAHAASASKPTINTLRYHLFFIEIHSLHLILIPADQFTLAGLAERWSRVCTSTPSLADQTGAHRHD
jgi:hypothetical protein